MKFTATKLFLFAAISLSPLPGGATSLLPDDVSTCGLNITAQFNEGAPVDRFSIENKSTSQWSIKSATYDLTSSAGKLIFDIEDGGDGVEVFQPFRETGGQAKMKELSKLSDGSASMTLDFSRFDAGETFGFSIDVDDTLTNSQLGQIRVTESEIAGAQIILALRGPGGVMTQARMDFTENAKARVVGKTC